jgi:hypothetical protein
MVMESSHGDTATVQWIVRESSHSDIAGVQWIESLVAKSEAACAYNSERVFNNRVKMNTSIYQNWIVLHKWISVPVSDVLCST